MLFKNIFKKYFLRGEFVLILVFLGFSFTFAQSCPSQTTYTSDTAVLVGEITENGGDPNIDAWFRWGRDTSLVNSTPYQSLYANILPVRFCYTITNLTPCTTYYYQAVAKNSAGINTGLVYSFTTRCQNVSVSSYLPYSDLSNQTYLLQQTNNLLPIPVIDYSPKTIKAGTLVNFNASNSYDPDGDIVFYSWKINGQTVSTGKSFRRSFQTGNYQIELTVVDNRGGINTQKMLINIPKPNILIRTVTRQVEVPRIIRQPIYLSSESPSQLLNLELNSQYSVSRCSINELKFTLTNLTGVNRRFVIMPRGEVSSWFSPNQLTLTLAPYSSEQIKWQVNVPCNAETKAYLLTFNIKTSNLSSNYTTNLQVKGGILPLLGFTGILGGNLNLTWLLVFILIVINLLLWNKYIRKRNTNNSIS